MLHIYKILVSIFTCNLDWTLNLHGSDAAASNGQQVVMTQWSEKTSLEPRFFLDQGSKRAQLRYGPYTVPPRDVMNGMKSFDEDSAQKPCTNCLITWMEADLHYANGTPANADTNLWLHHTVLVNTAGEDTACHAPYERFFASGNERTGIDMCANGTDKTGYYLAADANIAMSTELMNMSDEEAETFLTITYEYISSPDESFAHLKLLWLDVGGCRNSDMPAFANKSFHYTSSPWTASTEGRVVGIGGHLHDGGTHLDVLRNGKTVCKCSASYSGDQTDEIDAETDMNMDMEHVSSISFCSNKGAMQPGDEWTVTAYYNTTEHVPMENTDGSLEPIMGISLVYYVEGNQINRTDGPHMINASRSSATRLSVSFLVLYGVGAVLTFSAMNIC